MVEDDRDIRDVLRRYLERAGHSVLTTASGAEALSVTAQGGVDLVLLDLGLPDIDGSDVLSEIRRQPHGPAIIVLSARSTVDERIAGLQSGADDYVTKPFSPAEVVLRVQAVLTRRPGRDAPDQLTFAQGRLRVDQSTHRVWVDDAELSLTPTEWGILLTLTAVPGRVYSRSELVNRVRGYEYEGYERSIDSHVKNLRRKLGAPATDIIETVLAAGYRLGWDRD